MADGAEPAKTGSRLFHQRTDGLTLQVFGLETIGHAAEIPNPSSGLRQRHPDMPAAAFARLARLRHHGAERHQIAGGVIEYLRRQFLRSIDSGRLRFGMVEAGRGLHQRVKPRRSAQGPTVAVAESDTKTMPGLIRAALLRREAGLASARGR